MPIDRVPTPSLAMSYTFGCTQNRGAHLFLPDDADAFVHCSKRVFTNYVLENYNSWCRFANDKGFDMSDSELHGPVLIRSTTKTSAWGVASWMNQSSNHDLMVHCAPTGGSRLAASVSFSSRTGLASNVHHRSGPEPALNQASTGERPTRDQCIFVSYFFAKLNMFRGRQIVAAAEPQPDRSRKPEEPPKSDDLPVQESTTEVSKIEFIDAYTLP